MKHWADVTSVTRYARVGHYPGQCCLPIPNKLRPANQKIHLPVTEGGVQTKFRLFGSEFVGNDCIKWSAVVSKEHSDVEIIVSWVGERIEKDSSEKV